MSKHAKFPLGYSWHSVNNFVFNPDVAFEDLQACCLGLAAKLEAAQQMFAPDPPTACPDCGSVDEHIHYANCPLAKTAGR